MWMIDFKHVQFACLILFRACSVGFGDICPSNPDLYGRIFLTTLALLGLGFFCGPILSMASAWQNQVPGGAMSLFVVTLAVGVWTLGQLENMSMSDAAHLTVITGESSV